VHTRLPFATPYDQVIGVYEACSTFAVCVDKGGDGDDEAAVFCATRSGQPFWFQLGGYALGDQGNFDFLVESTTSACCGATALSGLGTLVTNADTTGLPLSVDACVENGDLWYRWVAPSNGGFTVTVSTDFDVMIGLFSSCQSQETVCWDDGGDGESETIDLLASAGQSYYFQIGGYASSQGQFSLTFSTAAGTDSCSTAPIGWTLQTCATATLYTGTSPVLGSTLCQNNSYHRHTQCYMEHGPADWYTWTAPSSGQFSAAVQAQSSWPHGDFDTVVALWYNCSETMASWGTCDDACGAAYDQIFFCAQAGVTYYFQVSSHFDIQQGTYTFQINPAPSCGPCVASTCTNAQLLNDSLPIVRTDSTTCQTWSRLDPDYSNLLFPDDWFRWVSPANGYYQASIDSQDCDSVIERWASDCSQVLSSGDQDEPDHVEFCAAQGQSIVLRVGSHYECPSTCTNYELAIEQRTPSPSCSFPLPAPLPLPYPAPRPLPLPAPQPLLLPLPLPLPRPLPRPLPLPSPRPLPLPAPLPAPLPLPVPLPSIPLPALGPTSLAVPAPASVPLPLSTSFPVPSPAATPLTPTPTSSTISATPTLTPTPTPILTSPATLTPSATPTPTTSSSSVCTIDMCDASRLVSLGSCTTFCTTQVCCNYG
jgi:hypothetical protein